MISIEPIAVDRDAAAALLSVSVSSLESGVRYGRIPPPRAIGGLSRWLVSELRECAAALPVSERLPVGKKT